MVSVVFIMEVINNFLMKSVIMLSVIMLSVIVSPFNGFLAKTRTVVWSQPTKSPTMVQCWLQLLD